MYSERASGATAATSRCRCQKMIQKSVPADGSLRLASPPACVGRVIIDNALRTGHFANFNGLPDNMAIICGLPRCEGIMERKVLDHISAIGCVRGSTVHMPLCLKSRCDARRVRRPLFPRGKSKPGLYEMEEDDGVELKMEEIQIRLWRFTNNEDE